MRTFRPDWSNYHNPRWLLPEAIPDLNERRAFLDTLIWDRVPIMEVLRRFVCKQCGGVLEAAEWTPGRWHVRCQIPRHYTQDIERGLAWEARERDARGESADGPSLAEIWESAE